MILAHPNLGHRGHPEKWGGPRGGPEVISILVGCLADVRLFDVEEVAS